MPVPAVPPLDAEGFAAIIPVSRETLARITAYVELLIKWNQRINLIGPQTVSDIWRRHILDSAQVIRYLSAEPGTLVDIGTGAGLPGMVLAILGVPHIHLVESDARKAAFLIEAARITGVTVNIHVSRIEAVSVIPATSIVSRALAPLSLLLGYAERFLKPGASCYFHKGSHWSDELADARQTWHFTPTIHQSLSDPLGVIIQLESIARERRPSTD
jgi:16S rRNA (guanine527-N7)-methyltransferase